MQMVEVLAALGGEARIVLMGELLARGPASIEVLARRIGASVQDTRRAVAALAAVGLVAPTAAGLEARIAPVRTAVDAWVAATPLGAVELRMPELRSQLRLGRIARIPPAGPARTRLLDAVVAALPPFDDVPEGTLTAWLAEMGDDPVLLRRLLIDEDKLRRTADGTRYWRVPPDPATTVSPPG